MNNLSHINEWVRSLNHDACHSRVVEVSWSEWCQWGHSQELRLYRCITRTLCRFFHDLLHGEIYPMHSLQWVFSPALLFLPKPVKLVLIRISPVSQIRKFQGFLFFVCLFVCSFVCFALLCFLSSIIISSELKPNNGIIHLLPCISNHSCLAIYFLFQIIY